MSITSRIPRLGQRSGVTPEAERFRGLLVARVTRRWGARIIRVFISKRVLSLPIPIVKFSNDYWEVSGGNKI
jgi:hypothetical protein